MTSLTDEISKISDDFDSTVLTLADEKILEQEIDKSVKGKTAVQIDDGSVEEKTAVQFDNGPVKGKTAVQIDDECIDSEMLMEKELMKHIENKRLEYNKSLLEEAKFDQGIFNSQVFKARAAIGKIKSISSEIQINSDVIASEYTLHAKHIQAIADRRRPEVGYDNALSMVDMCIILNKKMKSTIPEINELENHIKLLNSQLAELVVSTEGLIGSVNKLST